MIIRDERPSDIAGILALLARLMGVQEAQLVDDLRADGDAALSLVAEEESRLVGHSLFSPLEAPFRALALAPLAVARDRQGAGIGSALIRQGLERVRRDGWEAVFVLGEPDYYGRFGFDVAKAAGFDCPYSGPFFMALPLGDVLPVGTGSIIYPRAFSRLQ